MKPTILVFLMCLWIESFGAIIFIRGQTYPLEYKNERYYLPLNFVISPGTTNLSITMDGIDKLCFLNTAPQKMLGQISEINIIIHGYKTVWNCFPYRTTIHEARP